MTPPTPNHLIGPIRGRSVSYGPRGDGTWTIHLWATVRWVWIADCATEEQARFFATTYLGCP